MVADYLVDDHAYKTLGNLQGLSRAHQDWHRAVTSRILFVPVGNEDREGLLDRVRAVVDGKVERGGDIR